MLALDRDDKPRPTPESSRGYTTEAAEQRVERPSVSSDLGPNREEILAGRPFYLRAGMSVSTGILPPFETNGHTLNCPVCLLV